MKSQVRTRTLLPCALAIALGFTGCGADQKPQAFNQLQTPAWVENGAQSNAERLDDPINHQQHHQVLLSGNYSDCYQDQKNTALAFYRACYNSSDLLYVVLANYPSILQQYNIDALANEYGYADPNQIELYLAAAKNSSELRENLLLELWGLLTSDDTTFKFRKVKLKKGQSGYVYACCWNSATDVKTEEPHYALKEISQISDYVVEITVPSKQGQTETGQFLLEQGFAPFYEQVSK